MKVFQVGGSVRDELLGLPIFDRDWVVVGATPEDMMRAGFKPVGRDFPVFLHPQTHEEYALARTERKTAPGYRGFTFHAAPDVTLEEDLARRDFTLNAMARQLQPAVIDAPLIDPFNGADDLRIGLLRHVGPAFSEDPVRILRCARFVARFGFRVSPDTLALMRAMTLAGEVDALVPERVWQEVARGLMERDPVALFALLEEAGALVRVAPALAPWRPFSGAARGLAAAARANLSLEARFAALCSELGTDALDQLCIRLKVPSDCRELASLYVRHHEELQTAACLDAKALAELVRAADGLRQPARFSALVAVTSACAQATDSQIALVVRRLQAALAAVRGVDAGAVARQASSPLEIQAALGRAREQAVAAALANVANGA